MAQIYASKTNEIQKYETEHENRVRSSGRGMYGPFGE